MTKQNKPEKTVCEVVHLMNLVVSPLVLVLLLLGGGILLVCGAIFETMLFLKNEPIFSYYPQDLMTLKDKKLRFKQN
jgi:hypothetical protein